MLKRLAFVLICMLLGAGVGALVMYDIAPDRREPPNPPVDSLMYGSEACMGCVETGRKKVIIFNRKGQVICAYYDVMSKADSILYNHSKIPGSETTILDLSNDGTGQ